MLELLDVNRISHDTSIGTEWTLLLNETTLVIAMHPTASVPGSVTAVRPHCSFTNRLLLMLSAVCLATCSISPSFLGCENII